MRLALFYFVTLSVALQVGPDLLRSVAEDFINNNISRIHARSTRLAISEPLLPVVVDLPTRTIELTPLVRVAQAQVDSTDNGQVRSKSSKHLENLWMVIRGGDISDLPPDFEMIFHGRLMDAVNQDMVFDAEEYTCKGVPKDQDCFLVKGRKYHAAYVLYVSLEYKREGMSNLIMRLYDINAGRLMREIKEPFEGLEGLGMINLVNSLQYLKIGTPPFKSSVRIETPGVKGVNVYLDDWRIGRTPFNHLVSIEVNRNHKLTLRKEGYKTVEHIINIGSGDGDIKISITMESDPRYVPPLVTIVDREPVESATPVVADSPAVKPEAPTARPDVPAVKPSVVQQPPVNNQAEEICPPCRGYSSKFGREHCQKTKCGKK